MAKATEHNDPREFEASRSPEDEREIDSRQDGWHLRHKEARNAKMTEEARVNPRGGAHSDKPDPGRV